MERTCSQTIKIPFPIRTFYGTEVTVDIPRTGGEILKNIKLVLDFSTSPNTLGSKIVEKAEILVDDETIQTTYGEFLQVENVFNTSAEKYDKLIQLMCVSAPGTMYMRIPFEDLYLSEKTKTQIRILFSSELSGELIGHLLVDYHLYETPPKFPYVQQTTQIQRFSRIVNSPKSLKMLVYAVGPVYQLYFTVRDTTTNSYIDALTNVTLNFGEKERFNLTGKYLRYVEPLKRIQTYAAEPMYMYCFCTNPNVPSGSTHFPDNSFFVLDFYENSSNYEVTIWAKSHDFLYTTEKTTKRIFESTEMLLDTTMSTSTSFQTVPLRVSYINYSSSIVVFYSSLYEISNVAVTSDLAYTVTQNTIEFQTGVDSVFGEYTANVVFSAQGFGDATCYFRFRGNNTYLENIVYTSEGNYPTHIDLGQNFHYLLGNVFDFSNVVFTSNIQSLSVDELKNYAFTTYTTGPCNVLGGTTFTGPGSIVAKYDENMNLLFTVTTLNSNVTELASANTYGLSFAQSGTVVSRDLGYSYTASAGTANVFVDVVTPDCASIRFGISASNITANSRTTNFGNGTDRASLIFQNDATYIGVSNIRQVKTALETFSNGQPIWSFMYSSTSSGSGVTIPAASNGYLVWSPGWSKTITNVTGSNFDSKLVVDKMTDSVYLVAGYTSTTPTLTGFTFAAGTGFFVVKFDRFGNTKYVVSFVGTGILSFSPILDSTTGRFMISVTSQLANLLNVYNGTGTLMYSGPGKYQFFAFDDFGSVTANLKDLSELFAIQKPSYFTPLCSSKFFDQNVPDAPQNKIWSCFTAGTSNAGFSRVTTDSNGDVYTLAVIDSGFSNVFDKYGDNPNVQYTPSGTTTAYISKFSSNCVYSNQVARVTNIVNDSTYYWLFTKGTSIYILVTTNPSGSVFVYNRNNTLVLTFTPSGTETSLLLVKFDTVTGTYGGYISVNNSTGYSISGDTSGNLYITGVKIGTAAQNIIFGGGFTGTGTIPLTFLVPSFTSFVIKVNSSDAFQWRAYVDGHEGVQVVSAIANSSGSVYMSGAKRAALAARINGSTINTIPITPNIAAYSVKFNSSGVYATWYSHVVGTTNPNLTVSTGITSSNELAWLLNTGEFTDFGTNSNVFVNNVRVATFSKIQAVSSTFIKYTSSDTYDFNVRAGMGFNIGNSASGTSLSIDRLNNFLVSIERNPFTLAIYDKNGTLTTVPASAYSSGIVYKINTDGTVTSGNYVYTDSSANDGIRMCVLDKNGDIFACGTAGGTSPDFGYTRYFTYFDGVGYKGLTDIVYNQVSYGYLFKSNANFTFNKISL